MKTGPPVSFRLMTRDDLEPVLANEVSAHEFPWTPAMLLDCLENCRCWTVSLAGELCGHAIVRCISEEAELLNLCIGRHWQGLGLGGQLLDFLLDRLRGLSVRQVFAEVRVSNGVAIALYQGRGFKEHGRRRDYYPTAEGREDAWLLVLEL